MTNTSKDVRVALYVRISTDEETQIYSLGAQEKTLRKFAEDKGWTVARVYREQESGAKFEERPALQEALDEADQGAFDVFLVVRTDRLTRSTRALQKILERLEGAGVVLRAALEPFDTSEASGRFMLQMMAAMSTYERELIIDRIKRGNKEKASRGFWLGPNPPYGYERDPSDARLLTIVDSEAAVVRRIFDHYIEERLGATAIRESLNASGYRTRSGHPWSTTVVLGLLSNPTYAGYIRHRDDLHEGVHEAIIDRDHWEQAQEIRLSRQRHEDRTKKSDYLLSGLLRCDECGKAIVGNVANKKSPRGIEKYRYYTCGSVIRRGRSFCSADRIRAEDLEREVLKAIVGAYESTSLFREAVEESNARRATKKKLFEGEVRKTQREITATETKLQRYYDAFEVGSLSAAELAERIRTLQGQQGQLAGHLADLERDLGAPPPVLPSRQVLEAVADDLRQLFQSEPSLTTRAFLACLVKEIKVAPGRVVTPRLWIPTFVSTNREAHPRRRPKKSAGNDSDASHSGVRALSGLEPESGIEPLTYALRVRCSAV